MDEDLEKNPQLDIERLGYCRRLCGRIRSHVGKSSLGICHSSWRVRRNLKWIYNGKSSKRFGLILIIQSYLIAFSEPIHICDQKNQVLWYANVFISSVVMIEMLLKIIYCGLIFGNGREHEGGYLTNAQNIFEFSHSIVNFIWVGMAGQSCAPQSFWLKV